MTKTLDVYVRVHGALNIVSGPLDFHGANVFFYSSEGQGVSRSRMDQEILRVVFARTRSNSAYEPGLAYMQEAGPNIDYTMHCDSNIEKHLILIFSDRAPSDAVFASGLPSNIRTLRQLSNDLYVKYGNQYQINIHWTSCRKGATRRSMGGERIYVPSERMLQRNNLLGNILCDAQTFIQDPCASLRRSLQQPQDTSRYIEDIVTNTVNTIQNDVVDAWRCTQDFFTSPFRISGSNATQQLENLTTPSRKLGGGRLKCKIPGCAI